MEKLVGITDSNTTYVDAKTKAFPLEDNKEEIASFDDAKVVEDEKTLSDEEAKKEKYKNLSIDDLFKM